MADIRNFIMNSDYPTPFLVWSLEESLTVPVGAYFNAASKSVAHGLPFTPMLIGQWSTNANFVPAYDLANDMPIFTGTRPDYQILVGADDTYIRISATHIKTTAQTIYFRFFSFLPPDYDGTWTNVLDDNTNFKLNSDFNYPKVVASGSVTVPDQAKRSYNHQLGYIPQVRAWKQLQTAPFDNYSTTWNILVPAYSQTTPDGLLGVSSNAQTVDFGNYGASGSSLTYKYLIFGDEV